MAVPITRKDEGITAGEIVEDAVGLAILAGAVYGGCKLAKYAWNWFTEPKKTYHPEKVKDIERDENGNVTRVTTKTVWKED